MDIVDNKRLDAKEHAIRIICKCVRCLAINMKERNGDSDSKETVEARWGNERNLRMRRERRAVIGK